MIIYQLKNILDLHIWGLFFISNLILLSSLAPFSLAQNEIFYVSPFKQFQNGVSSYDVKCKTISAVLVIKQSNGFPACVTSQTAQKLVDRGWGLLKKQMIWFEFDPFQCQTTPWDAYWLKIHSMPHDIAPPPSHYIIYTYFKNNDITIFGEKATTIERASPACDIPSGISFYFLVSESDRDKMTNLGYKIAKMPLPSDAFSMR